MFGNPGDLIEQVAFKMVFSGMGSIFKSEVWKVVLGEGARMINGVRVIGNGR